jgi:hypothetical protein
LADSTHPLRRRTSLWLACVAVVLASSWAAAPSALADGDPASDVLATQTLFLPQDGAIPVAQQDGLATLVAEAQRTGYPVRVALIATQSDLGSVTALWRQPASYARFLGQELSQVFRGTLLVVMPDGFGVYRLGPGGAAAPESAAALSALPGMRGTLSRGSLGGAAITAVQHLAAAAGHRLTVPSTVGPRPAGGSASGVDVGAWLTFGIGAALMAAAWTASLRVRPPRRRDGVASPHGS